MGTETLRLTFQSAATASLIRHTQNSAAGRDHYKHEAQPTET